MQSKFLLLLGPSGVGKSAVIRELKALDSRFTYISPFVTRPLREGESDKIYVSSEELDALVHDGKILVVNELYGVRYATPREPIEWAFEMGQFPVLDWPVARLDVMQENYPQRILRIYLEVDSAMLRHRLDDGRDPTQSRLKAGLSELEKLKLGEYDHLIDHRIMNQDGEFDATTQEVYKKYLSAIGERS